MDENWIDPDQLASGADFILHWFQKNAKNFKQ